MPTPSDLYRQALILARDHAYALNRQGVARLYRAFAAVLNRLAAEEGTGRLTAEHEERLRQQVDAMLRALQVELTRTTEASVGQTMVDLVEIHRQATAALFRLEGLTMTVRLNFDAIPVRALAAMVSRPGAVTFQTLYRRRIEALAPEIDTFLDAAVARGVSAGQGAKDLARLLARDDPALTRLLDRADVFAGDLHRGAGVIDYEAYGLDEVDTKALREVLYDARRIQVSETNNALRAANDAAVAESPTVLATQWQRSGRHHVPDVCDMLAETDAYGYGAGMYPAGRFPVAPHPHCFTPDTEVQGSFVGGFRAQYRGEIIQLRTRSGKHITLTPNHPVLTPGGFVAAGDLRQGCQLIGYSGDGDIRSPHTRVHHRPARIDEVFAALAEDSPIVTRYLSPEDFHGDAAFMQPDVDIVGANGHLLPEMEAAIAERRSQLVFVLPAVETLARYGSRALDFLLQSLGLATSPGPRVLQLATNSLSAAGLFQFPPVDYAGFRGRSRGNARGLDFQLQYRTGYPHIIADRLQRLAGLVPADDSIHARHPYRVGPAADIDSHALHAVSQGVRRDASLARELLERFPGFVAVDEVVEIGYRSYTGHVYDLRSEYGYIIAGGLVTSNCGCYAGRAIFRRPSEWNTPKPAPHPLAINPAAPEHTERWADSWSDRQREVYQGQFAAILSENTRARRAA